MKAEFIDAMGSDLTPANAARVSFDKESDWDRHFDASGFESYRTLRNKDVKLINYLADHGHTSCFEHQALTVRLKVPIFVARQIQRHRTFAYNEVSRRYVKENLEFYFPEKWRKAADNVKQGSSEEEYMFVSPSSYGNEQELMEAFNNLVDMYGFLVRDGMAAEQARMILPQNLYTSFYMTGNLRNWSHFLHLRLDPHAQQEVREIAQQIADIVKTQFPVSYEALMKDRKQCD